VPNTTTVIVGAGHCGLAMSHCLAARSIDHVVLERRQVANSWRTQRWDSLRLLTPNWMTRLPYLRFGGEDADGFMRAGEVAAFLRGYASTSGAPVVEHTPVTSVRRTDDYYRVETDSGIWRAEHVVVATGHAASASVPRFAAELPDDVFQTTAAQYRNPGALPDGGVLVVGAAASGVQIARELADAGRPVVLSVGRHTRLSRQYRGLDSFWWLDQMGTLKRTRDSIADTTEPSLQLSGGPAAVELPALEHAGVRLAGRMTTVDGPRVTFRDDLAATTHDADHRLTQLLDRIDRHIDERGLAAEVWPREPLRRIGPAAAASSLDLQAEGISTVVWSTGYRRTYPWLQVPVLDAQGEIVHRAGVTAAPGLFVVGMGFQTRRNSTFIDGVGHDAALIAEHIAGITADPAPSRAS
jgi:putative flavoprotein involved in K+ transport